MGFRLYLFVSLVASASCIELYPESHAQFKNCPTVPGPSILKHLDFDNAGVERLVVYFYKPKNSHQIVSFIPSREYQECIEDIAMQAGETLDNTLNVGTILGLFERSLDRTIRYAIKPRLIVTESPVDVWAQPWDIYQHHGSPELNKTPDTGESGEGVLTDVLDHGHDSPNDVPVVHGTDVDKRPDWHIPLQEPNDLALPWQPDKEVTSLTKEINDPTTDKEKHISIERPDREKSQNLYVNNIEPLRPEDNLKPMINGYVEEPVIKPVEHTLMEPISSDKLRPVIRPVENSITPHHPDENYRPDMNHIIIEPNHPLDQYQPLKEDEIAAPVIRPTDNNPVSEPNRRHDDYGPVTEEDSGAQGVISIDNNLDIEPNGPHHHYRPDIEEDSGALEVRPIDNDPVIEPHGPHHHYRPDMEEDSGALGLRPIDNDPVIEPNGPHYHYRPDIEEDSGALGVKPIDNDPVIEPNGPHHQYLPAIEEEIDSPMIRPILNNLVIRPYQLDETTIIGDNIETPVIRPKNGPFPYSHYNDEIQYQSNLENVLGNSDYNDYDSKEVNGQLNINGGNINSFIMPKGDHGNIIQGDIDESLNSQNEKVINALLSQKHHLNEPSLKHDKLNLVYKWHKVQVPRLDSSGNVYGWVWKSVRSPIRSKSVKWSYYESSSGKKHQHWKHKSSSKIFHHSSNANFDAWLKKQLRNMQNDGNMIPSNDNYMYTVKIAIEKALNTNGIRVKNGRVLVDAEGNVLRLDNIQLRPIYIGRSLAYDRIMKGSANSINYQIPANTPFLKGLLVTVISPPRTLGIVPLGVTSLPRVKSHEDHDFVGRELRPISLEHGLNKLIAGGIKGVDEISPRPHLPPKVPVDDSTSLSEERPEYRIIGGSFAVGSGAPLANKGRSGKD